jgi:chromate transporter
MKVARIPGVFAATLGNILPSVIIMLILAKLYEKYSKQTLLKRVLEGVRPVVVSAIFVAGISLLQLALLSFSKPDFFAVGVFIVAFIALNNKKVPLGPIILLVLGALTGIVHYLVVAS